MIKLENSDIKKITTKLIIYLIYNIFMKISHNII